MSELLAPVQVEIASYPKKSPPRHKINDKLMYLYHRETTSVNNSQKNISITAWSKKLGRIKDTKIRPSPAGIYEDTRQTAVLAFHPIVQIVISLAPPHRGLFTYSTKSCIPAKACLQKKKGLNIKIAEIRTCSTDIMRLRKLHQAHLCKESTTSLVPI